MNYMRQQDKPFRTIAAFVAALAVLSLASATPALAAQQCTDNWTGKGNDGNWFNGTNWSTGMVPGSTDTACIEIGGAAVSMGTSGDTILNLALGSGDSLTFPVGNVLDIAGTSIVNSGQIVLPSSNQSSTLVISSGGTTTLSGGGTITLNSSPNDLITGGGSGGNLVNQSTIQGAGGIHDGITFINSSKGVINANQSGTQLTVGRFPGTTVNKGLIEATSGGQLFMGSLTLLNVGGTISASAGSSVVLQSQGEGGETITGGALKASGTGIIYVDHDTTIDGTSGNTVTTGGTFVLNDGPGPVFQGNVNNKGTIKILSSANAGVGVDIPGGQTLTLTGTGSVTMGDGTNNSYNSNNTIGGGGTLVNEQLIHGTGSIQNLASFSNSGTINADIPPGSNNLQLFLEQAGASTNTGTLEATNGGTLVVTSTKINNAGGTIAAGAKSVVVLTGIYGPLTISGGTYTTSDGGFIYAWDGTTFDGSTNAITNSGTLVVPNAGTPEINAQGTFNNTGTIQLLPNSSSGNIVLQIASGENLTLTGSGKVIMGDGTNNSYNNLPVIGDLSGGGGMLTNQSTIEGSGVIASGIQGLINSGTINGNVPVGSAGLLLNICCDGTPGILNSGTLEASNGGLAQVNPGTSFSNTGTLNAAANSTIDINPPFLNLSGSTLTGGTYNVTGTLQIPGNITTNDAKITLNGKASQILNPNTNALTGFVTNGSKGSFNLKGGQSFTSAGTFTNQGAISIAKGSTFTVGTGGSYVQMSGRTTVNGKLALSTTEEKTDDSDSDSEPGAADIRIAKGALFGNGGTVAAHLSSSGTVVPADSMTSVGKLKVTGAYTQGGAGALDANIAGANSGQFNVLNVTGTATLDGTLNIKLLNNFVPLVGAEFEILTARAVKGVFTKVNGLVINNSEQFTVNYNSNSVTLTVVAGH